MRYYQEDAWGRHLFYLEVNHHTEYGNFVETSLPEQVWDIPEYLLDMRKIVKHGGKRTVLLKMLMKLADRIYQEGKFTDYYFHASELTTDDKYDEHQAAMLSEMIWTLEVDDYTPILLENNPVVFRFLVKEFSSPRHLLSANREDGIPLSHFSAHPGLLRCIIEKEVLGEQPYYQLSMSNNPSASQLNMFVKNDIPTFFYFTPR